MTPKKATGAKSKPKPKAGAKRRTSKKKQGNDLAQMVGNPGAYIAKKYLS